MHQIWLEVLNRLLLLAVQVVVVGALLVFHRYAPAVKQWIDRHTTLTERQIIAQIGKEAFRFAETAFTSSPGQVKLDEALKYASQVANAKGLNVSESEFRASIEQAVQDEKTLQAGGAGTSAADSAK